jgi:hypothetical protein
MSSLVQLIASLKSSDPAVRNRAAIALMDQGDSKAVEPLVEAIERPENRLARGTLIYALSAFSCQGRFGQIFRWAVEGGYEASQEALSIIQGQHLRPRGEELEFCKALLHSSGLSPDDPVTTELSLLLSGNEG